MIKIIVEDKQGIQKPVEIPEGINLNLMEVLKASGYDILATCGGIALCATCQVEVVHGLERLPPAHDQEMDMLDILPDANANSRLACQLRINKKMDGMIFRIASQD
ncbi:MAG: 2Fe-2S iron-sulfur cluster-binding protein [Mucilaginibacter sp.]